MDISLEWGRSHGLKTGFPVFTNDVSLCKDFASLKSCILKYVSLFSLSKLAYHHLPHLGSTDNLCFNVFNVGFSNKLASEYSKKKLYRIDPTIAQVLKNTHPVWLDKLQFESKISKAEESFLDTMRYQNLGHCLVTPVFGPGGRNGFVSIGFGSSRLDYCQADLLIIQMFCQAAHLQYCSLLKASLPRSKTLSKREQEILTWVAKGKSNNEISNILGVKTASVVTYLQRAYDKLGVSSRVTAALRAIASGQIKYDA